MYNFLIVTTCTLSFCCKTILWYFIMFKYLQIIRKLHTKIRPFRSSCIILPPVGGITQLYKTFKCRIKWGMCNWPLFNHFRSLTVLLFISKFRFWEVNVFLGGSLIRMSTNTFFSYKIWFYWQLVGTANY